MISFKKLSSISLLIVSLILSGCKGGDDDNDSSSGTAATGETNTATGSDSSNEIETKTLTLSHGDFDFSAGKANDTAQTSEVAYDDSDGYLIFWSFTNQYPEGYAWGDGLWFSPYLQDTQSQVYYVQHLGEVSLDSVTTVDENSWPALSTEQMPLLVNHVYVVKAQDGYVKFKVLELTTPTSAVDYKYDTAKVEYQFSNTPDF